MSRNIRKLTRLLASGLASMVLLSSGSVIADGGDLAVVINAKNATAKLSKNELRRIFQTTKTTWDNGSAITPVNLPETSDLRQAFDRAVLGLDKDDVAKYWTDRKIRGGARPPRKAPTTSVVVKVVEDDVGAIGYVKSSEMTSGLRKVAIVHGTDVQ